MRDLLKTAAIAALTTFAFASPASAGLFDFDPAEGGVYASGFIGLAAPSDADFSGIQAPAAGVPGVAGAPANIEADLDQDVFYGGAVGVRLPFKYWKYFQPRVEAEISYFQSDVESGNFNGGNQTFSGDQSITFFLLNNVSDITWTDDQKVVPYMAAAWHCRCQQQYRLLPQ